MSNPYKSPTTSAPRVPTVRPISWPATIPQVIALVVSITVGWFVTKSAIGVALGAAVYLIYSFGSRKFIPRAHRRGVRLSLNQRYDDAIPAHQESHDFFTRHAWLDRYRAITMMSPGAMSFREMALINIAFAHSQIGNGERAKEYYRRALDEFPNSGMAYAALQMIESFERSSVDTESAT